MTSATHPHFVTSGVSVIAIQTLLLLSLCLLSGCSPQLWGVTVIPPDLVTEGSLHVAKERIEQYQRLNGRMPLRLSDTPPIPGKGDDLNDGWGNPLQYERLDNERCTIASLGADGVPGGQGENLDIIRNVKIVSWGDENDPSRIAD